MALARGTRVSRHRNKAARPRIQAHGRHPAVAAGVGGMAGGGWSIVWRRAVTTPAVADGWVAGFGGRGEGGRGTLDAFMGLN